MRINNLLLQLLLENDSPEKALRYIDKSEALAALEFGSVRILNLKKLIADQIAVKQINSNVVEFPYRRIR